MRSVVSIIPPRHTLVARLPLLSVPAAAALGAPFVQIAAAASILRLVDYALRIACRLVDWRNDAAAQDEVVTAL